MINDNLSPKGYLVGLVHEACKIIFFEENVKVDMEDQSQNPKPGNNEVTYNLLEKLKSILY